VAALAVLVVALTFVGGYRLPRNTLPVRAPSGTAGRAAAAAPIRPPLLLSLRLAARPVGGKRQLRAAPPAVPRIDAGRLTRALDRRLAGWPGRITATVADLATGRTFRYRRGERMITASTVKVEILMGLLLTTPWRGLDAELRRMADAMIRASDNRATDRLWEQLGYAAGLNRVSWALGLRHTGAVDGICVDLYCWGVVRTTADDQVRLMRLLAAGGGPLAPADRAVVLALMRRVVPGQRWGVSAGACPGDTVAVKNGWMRRVHNRLWVIDTVGLITGRGHRYAVAVLSEGSRTMSEGVARVEQVTRTIMAAFRGARGCGTAGGPSRARGGPRRSPVVSSTG